MASSDIKDLKEVLEASKEFKDWSKKNPDFYLVHLFLMSGHEPQVGYYNKKTDKIVTFDVGDKIILNPPCDVFKEAGVLRQLDSEKVKVKHKEAMDAALVYAKENYKDQIVSKNICILQYIKNKLVYNITLITGSFKMINVRVDAENKKIVNSEIHSILDLASG